MIKIQECWSEKKVEFLWIFLKKKINFLTFKFYQNYLKIFQHTILTKISKKKSSHPKTYQFAVTKNSL